ncbi:MAG: deoxyguanosinetriphosphate triphosphohydrolase [Thermodesulfobacteriota bacterium]
MECAIRAEAEERENAQLSPYACRSVDSRGRRRPEPECAIRTAFQRDRDRIIHCKAFRRLKHKTQVFLAPAGDHYRTRLTHVLEVSQIARTIAGALCLNEPLTEAIALGHDLGHTPFGHAGERVLNELNDEGFKHYLQSLRVVDILENKGAGLNLTHEVRNGILFHSKGREHILPNDPQGLPETLEGQVVRLADIIAYVNHDLDDALRAGVIGMEDVPASLIRLIGDTHSRRINTMVRDVICRTRAAGGGRLAMSGVIIEAIHTLRNFLFEKVYETFSVHDDFVKAKKVVRDLFAYLVDNPHCCGDDTCEIGASTPQRRATDFIAGMTDRFALNLYSEIFLPKPWSVL